MLHADLEEAIAFHKAIVAEGSEATNLPPEGASVRSAGFPMARFCPSDDPSLLQLIIQIYHLDRYNQFDLALLLAIIPLVLTQEGGTCEGA